MTEPVIGPPSVELSIKLVLNAMWSPRACHPSGLDRGRLIIQLSRAGDFLRMDDVQLDCQLSGGIFVLLCESCPCRCPCNGYTRLALQNCTRHAGRRKRNDLKGTKDV